jgi:hypothetical protein
VIDHSNSVKKTLNLLHLDNPGLQKAILMALYPTDLVNLNFCPDPKFEKLVLVHNWQ